MEPFVHLPEYPFVICKVCQIGCVTKEIISHLRQQHALSIPQAKEIYEVVHSIPGMIADREGLRHWSFPRPTTAPVPFIAPPVSNGLGCQQCSFITRHVWVMQQHYKRQHGWVNDRKAGRVPKRKAGSMQAVPWRTGVTCQQFFRGRTASQYFEVGRPAPVGPEAMAETKEGIDTFIQRIHEEDKAWWEEEVKETIQAGDDKWEANAWVHRTGWAVHLQGVEKDKLRATMHPVQDDEPELQRKQEILERVMDSAYTAASQHNPGSAPLFEVERTEAHGGMPTTPFTGKMEADTWERYKATWTTLMRIWQRIQSWAPEARPPYRMTACQQDRWAQWDRAVTAVVRGTDRVGRYTDDRLDDACLQWIMAILDHAIASGNHYDNILISGLAVMGIGADGTWVAATEYTPIYSAVIKVARLLVLYQSVLERNGEIARLCHHKGSREAEQAATGLFPIVRAKVRRFMTRIPDGPDAQPTPMHWIISTRTYGFKIRYTTVASETIDWRGDTIVHQKVRLGMSQLSDMLHNVVVHARRTLATLAMVDGDDGVAVQDALPRIPWSQIEDHHGERDVYYSFLRNPANDWWVASGAGWVPKQIAASDARQAAWVAQPLNTQHPYRGQAIRQYGQAVDTFREQMWVLMHMTGGQPARSPEILGLRMWNTTNGGVRNIFVHVGMVCFVTMYHKGFRRSNRPKIIHRYVPREVGELLVWYMWLVLPFWQGVQGRVQGKRVRSAFLWADEVVSNNGQKASGEQGKRADKSADESGDESADEEAAFMEWYRERKWTRGRVLRAMRRYSEQYTGQSLTISGWRQIAIGISNRYFNNVFGPAPGEDDENEDALHSDPQFVDSVYDLQAGHGSHVAGMIYAREFGQGDAGTLRSRDTFRKVSMQWHQFFGLGADDRFGAGVGGAGLGKRARSRFEGERYDLRRRRFERLYRTDIQGQLKQMMGKEAEFRGLQEQVIRAVIRGMWPIVQVAPTGGGKSLTFILPAFCIPDGVTIVITPLVALENDMEQRCRRLGIDGYVWKSNRVQRGAPLVFVTPESAVTKGFRIFVERLHSQQKLDRVVVDECHTLLEWSKTFRPRIGQVGIALQEFGVPVICLTATLKPSEEGALYSQLGFRPERVCMFRERTTRRNIRYTVEVVQDKQASGRRRGRWAGQDEDRDEDEDMVARWVCEVVRQWTETHTTGKVVVYGGTIKRVQHIAAAIGCVGYWNQVGTAQDKAKMMEDWVSSTGGMQRVIAATNALGLGVDVPDVRLVVHAGMPRDLRNFVQESGRGGRDGQRSESVVVVAASWFTAWCCGDSVPGPDRDQKGRDAWQEDAVQFAGGRQCRREVLDREMDGVRLRVGCEEGEVMCDVCERGQVAESMRFVAEAATDRAWVAAEQEAEEVDIMEADFAHSQQAIQHVEMDRRLQVMQEVEEVEEFKQVIDRWVGCCVVCKMEGKRDADHRLDRCPKKGTSVWTFVLDGIQSTEREMFAKKRFANFSACFICGMPQAICQQWVADDEDGRTFRKVEGKSCQYKGVLVGMYVGLRTVLIETDWDDIPVMMAQEGIASQNMDAIYEWLGMMIEWGGIQASRMAKVVYMMSKEIDEQ